jgi:hypothetical protein
MYLRVNKKAAEAAREKGEAEPQPERRFLFPCPLRDDVEMIKLLGKTWWMFEAACNDRKPHESVQSVPSVGLQIPISRPALELRWNPMLSFVSKMMNRLVGERLAQRTGLFGIESLSPTSRSECGL